MDSKEAFQFSLLFLTWLMSIVVLIMVFVINNKVQNIDCKSDDAEIGPSASPEGF